MKPKYVYLSSYQDEQGFVFDNIEEVIEVIKDDVLYNDIHPDDVHLYEIGKRVDLDIRMNDVTIEVI